MPRDTLTRDQIVKAAIELLDDEGLEGLNMRALGKRLNSAATAVYWHVGSKSNLITLACDQVWNEIPLPDLEPVDWRTAATSMATNLYAMLTRHLWLVQAFSSYIVYGPGKARHDDHNLAIYEAGGFTGPEADQAFATVFTFVLGNALGPSAEATLTRKLTQDGGDPEELLRDHLKVPVHGLIPSKLVNGGTESGSHYGNATIIGIWSDGQIRIERQLPPAFDDFFEADLAAAPATHTPAQLASARAAVEALMRNTENGISMIGGGTGHHQIVVRLLILTEPIYRRFEPIGTELIDLRPTIVPAPGG
jgi:AcrR family transcriptional regulator